MNHQLISLTTHLV